MQVGPWWWCCCSVVVLSLSVLVGGGGGGDALAVVVVHPSLHFLQHRGCVGYQCVDAKASVRRGRDKCPAHASPLLDAIPFDHSGLERRVDGGQVIGKIVHDGPRAWPGWWHWWHWWCWSWRHGCLCRWGANALVRGVLGREGGGRGGKLCLKHGVFTNHHHASLPHAKHNTHTPHSAYYKDGRPARQQPPASPAAVGASPWQTAFMASLLPFRANHHIRHASKRNTSSSLPSRTPSAASMHTRRPRCKFVRSTST